MIKLAGTYLILINPSPSNVKSDNKIGKVDDKKNLITKQENSEIGKKVLTDELDQ